MCICMPNWYSYFSEGMSVNIVNEAGKQQSAFNSLPGAEGQSPWGWGLRKSFGSKLLGNGLDHF